MNSSFQTHPNLIGATVTAYGYGMHKLLSPQTIVAVAMGKDGWLVIYTRDENGTIHVRDFAGCTVKFN
jgi:hypothetical protein